MIQSAPLMLLADPDEFVSVQLGNHGPSGHCFSVDESMTKDELIARLRSLGEQLNRDVSLTGTKEELALRVAELEEELDDTDDAAGQDTSVSPENALTGHENEVVSAQTDTVTDTAALVTVVALGDAAYRCTSRHAGLNLWHLCCRERRFVSLPVWQPK
ncbi:DNA packaging protein from bacteriophage origin [Escherichia coli]|nr:DNA packaging protein from bacteriophage origin [Escherichia coli]